MKTPETFGKTAYDLTALILDAAADYFDFFYAAHTRPAAFRAGGLAAVRASWAAEERRAALQRIHLLKRRELLRVKKTGDHLRCSLTAKGEAESMRRKIRRAPKRDDGKSVLVTFDVPERRRQDRDLLRGFLKSAGFIRLQQSVWSTDRQCFHLIQSWLEKQDYNEWVCVFLTEGHD